MKPLELRDERGMMVVLFAVILPLLLIMAALVWDTGNWWTHRKHLQTKADAAAFAGGGVWEFPCGTSVDARIVAEARKYAGPHMGPGNQDFRTTAFNPQIGGTPGEDIHVVLNGDNWWDDDAGLDPADSTSPLGSVCESKTLDVKATEENNNPLFGLLPFFPDLKRKARVEIREAEGITGLLPIAVRAPEPVSAAVFYNEQTGDIYKVKYFVKKSPISGLPGGLQGWSTYNTEDTDTWARFRPGAKVGVAIAISLRGACNTNLPGGPPGPAQTKIATSATPCFEDEVSPNTVSELCNQGGSTQIVNCHFATGNWPSEVVQSGLHFIRGYPTGNAGEGRPELRSAWLENVDCPSNAYFSSVPGTSPCNVKLTVKVDIGSLMANPPPNPPNTIVETRTASNTQVRYCLVRPSSANNECRNQFDPAQDLQCTGAGPEISCSTVPGTHLPVTRNSLMNAVAIEVKLQGTTVVGRPGCTLAVAGGGGG
nr:pilus assembly protein [Actinomycetota bacterium]